MNLTFRPGKLGDTGEAHAGGAQTSKWVHPAPLEDHKAWGGQFAPPRTHEESPRSAAQAEATLAAVCHDVQTPLTILLMQAQLLERETTGGDMLPPAEIGKRLATILVAARQMRDITQDLLNAAVQRSGHTIAPLRVRTELVALARAIVEEHALLSSVHQLVFVADPPTLEGTVDTIWVSRILSNLLSNAIKYSPAGGVVHVAVTVADAPSGPSAVLTVRDIGLGIPRDDLPHIFDRYRRGTNVVGRFAGTGLGLASARPRGAARGHHLRAERGRHRQHLRRLPPTSHAAGCPVGRCTVGA